MKKFAIQIGILVTVIFGALYFSYNQSMLNQVLPINQNLPSRQIKVGNTILDIEVADTTVTRSKGLSGREKLSENSGMLFIFPDTKQYQFWMKGMKFPLDFIFIREGKVVDLLKNIPNPESNVLDSKLVIYQPTVPIDMMLEVNFGFVDKQNIIIGDPVALVK